MSLVSSPGAKYHLFTDKIDPNPIVDVGVPTRTPSRSIGGLYSAVLLSKALGVQFILYPLDCELFYYGYGKECSETQLNIGFWKMPITDVGRPRIKN